MCEYLKFWRFYVSHLLDVLDSRLVRRSGIEQNCLASTTCDVTCGPINLDDNSKDYVIFDLGGVIELETISLVFKNAIVFTVNRIADNIDVQCYSGGGAASVTTFNITTCSGTARFVRVTTEQDNVPLEICSFSSTPNYSEFYSVLYFSVFLFFCFRVG